MGFFERKRVFIAVLVSVLVTISLLVGIQTNAMDVIRAHASPSGSNEHPPHEDKPKTPQVPTYKEISGGAHINGTEKLAYVTFLSGTVDAGDDLEKDNYFVAVRILIWQLVHNPTTRTKHDVVVMVTPTVSQSRRDRLAKDGAIIYPVEFLRTENDAWIQPEQHRWDDVMTKMRVWQMTQYSRIVMLDGDTMLRSSLDGVFDDPGAQILATKTPHSVNYTALAGEAPLPSTYLLASLTEVWDSTHSFPPGEGTGLKQIGYMNAGFFLLAPNLDAYNYYVSLLNIPGSFDPRYPEQNLMNHAHQWSGPMPWREISYTWNIRCPSEHDFDNGLVSMHEKWWTQPYIYENKRVKEWLLTRRYEMKGWYDAWDAKKAAAGKIETIET